MVIPGLAPILADQTRADALRIGRTFRAIAVPQTRGCTCQLSDGRRVEGIELLAFASGRAGGEKAGIMVHRYAEPGQARHAVCAATAGASSGT